MPDPGSAGAPGDALASVVRAVLRADPGRDALGLAELLWLAGLGSPPPAAAPEAARSFPGALAPPWKAPGADTGPAALAPAPAEPDASDETPDAEDEGVPERPVAVPGHQRLLRERDLSRALRPFRRRWPHGRLRHLDVDSTVAEYGRTGELSPVFSPAPERWFDLTLAVDRSTSMSVWQETADELGRLLASLNAFRTIRMLTFDADLPAPALRHHVARPAHGAQLSGPARPGPRGLVLVFSDCTARAWRSGHLWERLHQWGRRSVTTLVNPLPTRIWRHVGVDLSAVRVTSPGVPGAPNGGLRFRAPPRAGGLPVPTVTLSAQPLARWAHTLMRCSPVGCDALLVPASGGRAVERWEAPAEADGVREDGDALAKAFHNRASAAAARLAVLCSPFPEFGIPLLRLIAEELVPRATESDLAEFLVGGPVVPGKRPPAGDAESAWVRYRPAAREHFISLLSSREAWQLYDVLTRAVARGPVLRTRPRGTGRLPGGSSWAALAGGAALAEAPAQVLKLLGIVLAQEQAEAPAENLAGQAAESDGAEGPVDDAVEGRAEGANPAEGAAEAGPTGEADEERLTEDRYVTVSDGRSVTLRRGETISLTQAGISPRSAIRIETSWTCRRRRGLFRNRSEEIDMDVSAVLFSERQPVDVVFFRHLLSDDGSVRHSGDSLDSSRAGTGTESLLVDLRRVPVHVDAIVITLNSFTGQSLAVVESVTLGLVDLDREHETAVYPLAGGGTHTACILARLSRAGTDWCLTALGIPASGRTFQDLMPAILPLL